MAKAVLWEILLAIFALPGCSSKSGSAPSHRIDRLQKPSL
jgi:hypothetical protein